MSPEQRPSVFVGGLPENPDIPLAIQKGLDDIANVTVFTQGVSRLSVPIIESLLEALSRSDCAVFVFPEERDSASPGYRDALLQLGVMVGRLGRDRTFVVVPAGTSDVVIPTPLLGIGIAEYNSSKRTDGNVEGAVAVATTLIRNELRRLRPRTRESVSHEFSPSFAERLRSADSIYIWGMNLSDFLIQYCEVLEDRLAAGGSLRALLVAPDGKAVQLTKLRFGGFIDNSHEALRSGASLARLCRLCEPYPDSVAIRTLDYPFSYGAFLFDPDKDTGVAYVKQYTFRTTGGSRKPKHIYEKAATEWFDLVWQEGEQLWEASSPWTSR